ncbi:MAG TPA: alpha-glucosidase/alpha-galactosidase [Planctomycetota bacterium]|jgi:alpha-galactosidase
MSKEKREIKIAYIGGGSIGWARSLMSDLALCPQLTGCLALYDIDLPAAEENVRRAEMIFSHKDAKTAFKTEACADLDSALRGADFIVISIQPGPISLFASDLDIPARYGLPQTVGDSTGPGGISRALRAIPIYEDFAHRIMQICPNAWVINYTNPMTLCTATLYAAEPKIKAFGCCHEVFGAQTMLAELVEERGLAEECKRQEIELDISGVNHFTWATSARWNGQDLFPIYREKISREGFFSDQTTLAQERKAKARWFASSGLVAADLFRRFGALACAGDRHLAEFVPWYLSSETELHRWGVVLTPSSYRVERERDGRSAKARSEKVEAVWPSGEEGVEQMVALLGLGDLESNCNLPNAGQTPDLARGGVVESYVTFSRDRVTPRTSKRLPTGARELVRRIMSVQQMVLEAGLKRDKDLAFQAFLADPLMRLPTDTAARLFDEMLAACRAFLPGWKL